MNLVDWLSELMTCEDNTEAIETDALEDALLILRERAQESSERFQSPDGETDEEVRETLLEMAEILMALTDDLDRFLDTFDFQFVRAAIMKAQDLVDIRNELSQSLDYSSRVESQLVACERKRSFPSGNDRFFRPSH